MFTNIVLLQCCFQHESLLLSIDSWIFFLESIITWWSFRTHVHAGLTTLPSPGNVALTRICAVFWTVACYLLLAIGIKSCVVYVGIVTPRTNCQEIRKTSTDMKNCVSNFEIRSLSMSSKMFNGIVLIH